jgi:hypothetical protein
MYPFLCDFVPKVPENPFQDNFWKKHPLLASLLPKLSNPNNQLPVKNTPFLIDFAVALAYPLLDQVTPKHPGMP